MTAEQQVAELEYQLKQAMYVMKERDEEIASLNGDVADRDNEIEGLNTTIKDIETERDEAEAKLEKIKKWASMVEGIVERALFNVGSAIDKSGGVVSDAFREME